MLSAPGIYLHLRLHVALVMQEKLSSELPSSYKSMLVALNVQN